MTINAQTPNNSYVGDGINDTFAYTFRILEDDDIIVTVDDVLQVLATDYTLQNQLENSGDVVFEAGSIPGDTLVIEFVRETDRDQNTVYTPFDSFPAKSHEGALDKLTMITQETKAVGEGNTGDLDDHIADTDIHFDEASIDHANIQNVGSQTHPTIDAHIGNTDIHFSSAPVDGNPYARQDIGWININGTHLKLDATNGPLTGELGTQDVVPDDEANDRAVGAEGGRYHRMFGDLGVFVASANPLDIDLPTNADNGGIIGGSQSGAGTTRHIFGAGVDAVALLGRATAGAGATAILDASGAGALLMASAYAAAGSDARVTANGFGNTIQGYAYARNGGTALIQANYSTNFVNGYAFASAAGTFATIETNGSGGLVRGQANGSGAALSHGKISTSYPSVGAMSGGAAIAQTGAFHAFITAGSYGSFAHGWAYSETADADITASGAASFAFGAARSVDIIASAENSVQWGPGTNAEANSLQVGGNIRLKGTDGAPATPIAGDHWIESGVEFVGPDVTGGINTEQLIPRTSLATIGGPTENDRWDSIFGRLGIFVGGSKDPLTATLPSSSLDGALLVGSQNGIGTAEHVLGDPYRSILAMGTVTAGTGQTAIVESSGGSSFAMGSAYSSGAGASRAYIQSVGYGTSIIGGYAYSYNGGISTVRASGSTAMVMGRAYTGSSGSSASLIGNGAGGLIAVRCNINADGTGLAQTNDEAQFVLGRVSAAGGSARMEAAANAKGAFIQGNCAAYGGTSEMLVDGTFSYAGFVQGNCYASVGLTGTMRAGDRGAHASGTVGAFTSNASIQATGEGSFAHGFAEDTDILASAENSAQWGPGVNDQEDSLSVGIGPRFKGTSGAPTTPRNGDMWIDAGDVIIRSGGVNVTIA